MSLTEPGILLALILGALGGFALDLVQDGGLQWPIVGTKDVPQLSVKAKFLALGFLSNVLIGALAALITYALNPPSGVLSFIVLTLTSGIGGSAILKSYINAKQATDKEKEAANANAHTEALRADVTAVLNDVSVQAAPAAAQPGAGPTMAAPAPAPAAGGARTASLLRQVLEADNVRRGRPTI